MAFLTLYFELKAYWAVALLPSALNLLFVVGGLQKGKSFKVTWISGNYCYSIIRKQYICSYL